MKNENAVDALSWILSDIEDRYNEADKEKSKSSFADGRAEAYAEVIDIIKSRLDILNVQINKK